MRPEGRGERPQGCRRSWWLLWWGGQLPRPAEGEAGPGSLAQRMGCPQLLLVPRQPKSPGLDNIREGHRGNWELVPGRCGCTPKH